MKLKPSRYNFFYPDEAGGAVLFNSRTGGAMAADEPTARGIVSLLQRPGREEPVGSNLQRLKEALIREEFLVPDDLDELHAVVARRRARQMQVGGLNLTIAVTLACNFRCIYCYEDHPVEHMSRATAQALLRFARERLPHGTSLYVTWFGGEPLLNVPVIELLSRGLMRICEQKECSYGAYMVTNGYRLTAAMARRLAELGIKDFQVSIDGERETHDRQRPLASGRGMFEVLMRNVREIAANVSSLGVRINVLRGNVDSAARLVRRLEAMRRDLPALLISLGHVDNCTPRCGTDNDDLLTNAEFAELERALLGEQRDGVGAEPALPTPFDTVCCAVRPNMYVVSPDGHLFKCWNSLGRPDDTVGHIDGAVDDAASPWILFQPEDDAECRNCKLLPICQGGCSDAQIRTAGAGKHCTPFKYTLREQLAHWAGSRVATDARSRPVEQHGT